MGFMNTTTSIFNKRQVISEREKNSVPWNAPPPHSATAPSGPAPLRYRGFTITLRQ